VTLGLSQKIHECYAGIVSIWDWNLLADAFGKSGI
jgi:hypothetical protein